jgi:hypothetical protein
MMKKDGFVIRPIFEAQRPAPFIVPISPLLLIGESSSESDKK